VLNINPFLAGQQLLHQAFFLILKSCQLFLVGFDFGIGGREDGG